MAGVTVKITGTGISDYWLGQNASLRAWNWSIEPGGTIAQEIVTTTLGVYRPDDGVYGGFIAPPGGNYTVTPSKEGFVFSPASYTFNNLGSSKSASFIAHSIVYYSIGGKVTDQAESGKRHGVSRVLFI